MNKNLIRSATIIRELLSQVDRHQKPLRLPAAAWATLERIGRQLTHAEERGFELAAGRLRRELAAAIARVQQRLSELANTTLAELLAPAVPSLSDIYRELLEVESELKELRRDQQAGERCPPAECLVPKKLDVGPVCKLARECPLCARATCRL